MIRVQYICWLREEDPCLMLQLCPINVVCESMDKECLGLLQRASIIDPELTSKLDAAGIPINNP